MLKGRLLKQPPGRRQSIVTQSTGCANPELAEEIYQYYARPEAWVVAQGAPHALMRLRDAGEPYTLIHLMLPMAAPAWRLTDRF